MKTAENMKFCHVCILLYPYSVMVAVCMQLFASFKIRARIIYGVEWFDKDHSR